MLLYLSWLKGLSELAVDKLLRCIIKVDCCFKYLWGLLSLCNQKEKALTICTFMNTDDLQDSRESTGPFFNPLYHFHPFSNILTFIWKQFCMWNYYHVFLIAPLVSTGLLLDWIYHLTELPFNWFNDYFVYDYKIPLVLSFSVNFFRKIICEMFTD